MQSPSGVKEHDEANTFQDFYIKIQPMLMYASEIWGTERLDNTERVHMIACERFLGVPQKTPNKMVSGGPGRYSLFVKSTLRCLNYLVASFKDGRQQNT